MHFGENISPVLIGIRIHIALAALLGIAAAIATRSAADDLYGTTLYGAVTAALVVVWIVNFFVVLPVINPQFVNLVPYLASFASKVLFGLAAAGTLQAAQVMRPALLLA